MSVRMKRAWVAAVAVVLSGAGCASSGSGSSAQQFIPIISEPTGAIALADGQEITTPGFDPRAEGRPVPGDPYISKDGYETATVILTPDSQKLPRLLRDRDRPDNPAPNSPFVSDSGVYTLGARLLAILAGCSSKRGAGPASALFRLRQARAAAPDPHGAAAQSLSGGRQGRQRAAPSLTDSGGRGTPSA